MEEHRSLLNEEDYLWLGSQTKGFTGRRLTALVTGAKELASTKFLNADHLHGEHGYAVMVPTPREGCDGGECYASVKDLPATLKSQGENALGLHDFVLALRNLPYEPPYVIEGMDPSKSDVKSQREKKDNEEKVVFTVRQKKT